MLKFNPGLRIIYANSLKLDFRISIMYAYSYVFVFISIQGKY